MEQEELLSHGVYSFCTRPVLLMGCERKLLILTGMLSVVVVFAMASILGLVISLVLFFLGLSSFRKLAKADPFMSDIFIRQLQYRQKVYLATGTPFEVNNHKYK